MKHPNCKLTPEGLAQRLPLLNASAVCARAGVDYMRFRNWKFGAVKTLSDDELKRIAKVLLELSPNTKAEASPRQETTNKTKK